MKAIGRKKKYLLLDGLGLLGSTAGIHVKGVKAAIDVRKALVDLYPTRGLENLHIVFVDVADVFLDETKVDGPAVIRR
jgi:hypothetical protein